MSNALKRLTSSGMESAIPFVTAAAGELLAVIPTKPMHERPDLYDGLAAMLAPFDEEAALHAAEAAEALREADALQLKLALRLHSKHNPA